MEYLSYETLLGLHVYLLRDVMGEEEYGVLNEGALRSALARPEQAAHYEGANGIRQAAFLFHGLLMNHGFVQGNKRTAYLALEWFLVRNHLGRLTCDDAGIVAVCLDTIGEHWSVDPVEAWLREHCTASA